MNSKELATRAARHKRTFLRRRGIGVRSLDWQTREVLSDWALARARLERSDSAGMDIASLRWQIAAQNACTRLHERLCRFVDEHQGG